MSSALRRAALRVGRNPFMRTMIRLTFRLPLVGYAFRRVGERILPRGRIWVQIPEGPCSGIWMKVDPYWEPGYLCGRPEGEVLEMILGRLQPGGCFYDVGSHIGFYALAGSRSVGPNGQVAVFEPDPDNVGLIREHIDRNRLCNVIVVQAAVWNRTGAIQFERGSDAASRMGGAVMAETSSKDTLTLDAVTLDSCLDRIRPPTLIKVDVEGGEIAVLEGARHILTTHRPVLIIEVHDRNDVEKVQRLLAGFGYNLAQTAYHGANVYACFTHPGQDTREAATSSRTGLEHAAVK